MADVIDLTSTSPPSGGNRRTATSRRHVSSANASAPVQRPGPRAIRTRLNPEPTRPFAAPARLPSSEASLESSPGLFLSEQDDTDEEEYEEEDFDESLDYDDYMNASTDESGSASDFEDFDGEGAVPYSHFGPNELDSQPAAIHAASRPIASRPTAITNTQTRQPAIPTIPINSTKQTAKMPIKRSHTKSQTPGGVSEPASKKTRLDTEVVDMVDIEDEDDVQKLVQQQMLKAQREEGAARRKIADFKCVICLDDPESLSATTCGHLFCNECIKTTLRFGKPNAKFGKCPVCRGKVVIKDIVPLELKLVKKLNGKGKCKA